MKMLPIETDPYIRAITYHAFPSAILNPRCGGEKKAEIAILNSHSHSWKYDASRALVHRERDDFVFTGDKYADGVEGIICREARAEDEIIVHVKYVQYTQP
ncbi:MAG: hypothetical protein LBV27_03050 [Oscillospiraceae bacterium]|jgi:hypothetical protein|nr:hypothetical protein [Oscillospiraceae bacterium]